MTRDTVEAVADKRLHGVKRALIETAALPSHTNIEITAIAGASDLYLSEPRTGNTESALNGLKADLEQAGLSMASVVATNVYIDGIENFVTMNKAYAGFFGNAPPARTTVQTTAAAQGKQNIISVIAVK
jgi:enamine deaminase RidA (YjgF/YER057c/UK114 family)